MDNTKDIAIQAHTEDQEQWRKSIPAQVFLNHFFGLYFHIKNNAEAYHLQDLPYFRQFEADLSEQQKAGIRKHLLNSWHTEYTLRTTAQVRDSSYLKHALHWTFPQAYYSVQETLLAMLILHGADIRWSNRAEMESGRLIVKGAYPRTVSFYAVGHPHQPRLYRLPYGKYQPDLQQAASEEEAQRQIGQFLRTTHRQRALQVRYQVQSNPLTALRSQKTGKMLKRFEEKHWQQLRWRIGYTTIFNLLSRLRISANHREIERFVEADIDMKLFHESLLGIVRYLNFVHEAYVAKAVGIETFQQWVQALPDYLQESFIKERTQQIASVVSLCRCL